MEMLNEQIQFDVNYFSDADDQILFDSNQLESAYNKLMLVQVLEELPENAEAFIEKVQREIPNDPVLGTKKLAELSTSDPEFFNQLCCLQIATSNKYLKELAATASTNRKLSNVQVEQAMQNIKNIAEKIK